MKKNNLICKFSLISICILLILCISGCQTEQTAINDGADVLSNEGQITDNQPEDEYIDIDSVDGSSRDYSKYQIGSDGNVADEKTGAGKNGGKGDEGNTDGKTDAGKAGGETDEGKVEKKASEKKGGNEAAGSKKGGTDNSARENAADNSARGNAADNNAGNAGGDNDSEKSSVLDIYNTEPVPSGKPAPVEPEDAVIDKEDVHKCTISIDCKTILDNIEDLDKDKVEILPKDGIILKKTEATFSSGESVFDILLRETGKRRIHMEYSFTPLYNSSYIEGLANLYEFDCGELSGWTYVVNGWSPNYGMSRYQVSDGDNIEIRYTCNLGADL